MDFYKLVLPEFLNHQNSLFGGYLLKWIDEFAYIAVNLEFPNRRFVTVALDNVEFKHRICNGQILKFVVAQSRLGKTSVQYNVKVYGERDNNHAVLFETHITFVSVDADGKKSLIQVSG